jgi:4-hydroxy-3-polyprenylbenzoate decarboxylase
MTLPNRIIIGISGASGAIYGVRALELLQDYPVETHLVASQAAALTLKEETSYTLEEVKKLADVSYSPKDIAAAISSGSFTTMGMLVAPCSMKSLAEIATGVTNGLLSRAADVVLKEQRKLVLMVRETPFSTIHLENMQRVAQAGGVIFPPVPAFYHQPNSIDDIVNQTVGRALDQFGIDCGKTVRWEGLSN